MIWLRSDALNRYVAARADLGGTPLRADASLVGVWERLQVIDTGAGERFSWGRASG
ncbi:MAG: hypothetical protein HOY76_27325 [Streptomyces sp.]|nr:hypothetical protein [Streptomyces sp.]